jgi:hypothetical protein
MNIYIVGLIFVKNCNVKIDPNLLEKRVNSNFVSYFLLLVHDEGNKYLPIKQNSAEEPATNNQMQGTFASKGKANAENLFNASYSNSNTPQIMPAPTRKISLQPLNQNTPRTSQNNSPIDLYPSHNHSRNNNYNNNNNNHNNNNHKRNSNYSFPSNNSTPSLISPRNNGFPPPAPSSSYSSRLVGKPATLFDYIVTPIKSPGQLQQQVGPKPNETPVIISDFKQRFQQHQNSLNSSRASNSFCNVSYTKSAMSTPVNTSTASNIITNSTNVSVVSNKQEIELVETKDNEAKPKVDFSNLGPLIKKALTESDIDRVSTLAKFYTQLILNNFIVTINIELFFLFQLLTLNSIEDKNESQLLGISH